MRHGSLFSGIGGFDLAAEWMGWENVFHCEWNPFGQKVLNHYWPNAESFTDITKSDFTKYANTIDILTGGFPCQPYSLAGKRKGKEDERHLWPEMLRAIREISPRWILGENVRGLTNWNGGVVFDEVQADLETEGYEVLPFLLPACGVGAPHRRERIWFIANSIGNGHGNQLGKGGRKEAKEQGTQQRQEWKEVFRKRNGGNTKRTFIEGNATNAECIRQQGQGRPERQVCTTEDGNWKASWTNTNGRWPTQSPICNGNDGISAGLDVDTISFKEWREESLKAGGNAIVPQVAYEIFKAIQSYENL